jgi:hypothetical protein
MQQTIQYLPERHTDVTAELVLASPLDVLVVVAVAVLVVLGVWRFAVRRRRARARAIQRITEELDALAASDFDGRNPHARGIERLDALCDELRRIGNPDAAAPILLTCPPETGRI